jgi:hypothetical protein
MTYLHRHDVLSWLRGEDLPEALTVFKGLIAIRQSHRAPSVWTVNDSSDNLINMGDFLFFRFSPKVASEGGEKIYVVRVPKKNSQGRTRNQMKVEEWATTLF